MYELMGGYSDCGNRSGRGVWVQRTLQEVIGSYRSRTEEFWPAAQKWSWTWRSKTTLSFSNWKIMLILMTSPNSDTVTNIDNYKLILPEKTDTYFGCCYLTDPVTVWFFLQSSKSYSRTPQSINSNSDSSKRESNVSGTTEWRPSRKISVWSLYLFRCVLLLLSHNDVIPMILWIQLAL